MSERDDDRGRAPRAASGHGFIGGGADGAGCCDSYRRAMALSRRGFLRGAAAGLGALTLPSILPRMAFAAPAAGEGSVLVVVFLRGGADGLHMVAPLGDPFYRRHRPTLGLRDSGAGAARPLDAFFGLHPAMAPLLDHWRDGRLAIVHAVGQAVFTGSHFDAMEFLERGTPGQRVIPSGWLGRHLAARAGENTSIFRAVGFGGVVPVSLAGEVPATALDDLDLGIHGDGDWDGEGRFQHALERLYGGEGLLDAQARLTFQAIADLEAANPREIPVGNGAVYPETWFGTGMRQIAQMVKADLGMEVACLDLGGWDTHEGQGGAQGPMAELMNELARSLDAFATDLGSRLDRVTVVTMSEFGRRVQENGDEGTDHGYGSCLLALGGGIEGGRMFGEWPGLGPQQWSDGDLRVTTDVRQVLGEILRQHAGATSLEGIFPGFAPGADLGIARAR